jgi:RNase H-fold protein (predicted Holliday junction resolvase)
LSRLAAIDPGRSKCGLVLADPEASRVLAAGVLPPLRCRELLLQWCNQHPFAKVLLGDGTGSQPWLPWLAEQQLSTLLVPEAGTTLAARERYWQLERPRGWRCLLPRGLRLPPRDVDDVVAQILLERHLDRLLTRTSDLKLLVR